MYMVVKHGLLLRGRNEGQGYLKKTTLRPIFVLKKMEKARQ